MNVPDMKAEFESLRLAVAYAIMHPDEFKWTAQGLGMLRTYLDSTETYRINVWHSLLKIPGVTEIHSHPWDFSSTVMWGRLYNIRYSESSPRERGADQLYKTMRIKCGEGGGPQGLPYTTRLLDRAAEMYETGATYAQYSDEIHRTQPINGTVTLNTRRRFVEDHTARVFWPECGEYVSAKPRDATPDEIGAVLVAARKEKEKSGA